MQNLNAETKHIMTDKLANKWNCSSNMAKLILQAEKWNYEEAEKSLAAEIKFIKLMAKTMK